MISGRAKINLFSQIGSIKEEEFGDNFLQLLFLTLFVVGVRQSGGWCIQTNFSNNSGFARVFLP